MPASVRQLVFAAAVFMLFIITLVTTPVRADEMPVMTFSTYATLKPADGSSVYTIWLKQSLKDIGYGFEAIELPRRRAFRELQDGNIDAVLGSATLSTTQHGLVKVPAAFISACYAGYRLDSANGTINHQTLNIGIFPHLAPVHEDILKLWPDSRFHETERLDSAIKMLEAGRLDFFVLPKETKTQVEKQFHTALAQVTTDLSEQQSYVYLSQRHQNLALRLAKALNAHRPIQWRKSCQPET